MLFLHFSHICQEIANVELIALKWQMILHYLFCVFCFKFFFLEKSIFMSLRNLL